jgi:hypothetical protein
MVIFGLALLLILPNLTQPDYVLSSLNYNTKLENNQRNYVPFFVTDDMTENIPNATQNKEFCSQIMNQFNGGVNGGTLI